MFLPVNLNVQGRLCVLVGGGAVARRKCRKLAEYGARVLVVAPGFAGGEEAWSGTGVTLLRQWYERECLAGAFLAIAATDDPQVNERVAADAARMGILVQRADLPESGDFSFAATLRRGELTVSFATGGVIPALAARLKAEAAAAYDEAYGEFCRLVRVLKAEPAWAELDGSAREAVLVRLAAADVMELLRREGSDAALARMRQITREGAAQDIQYAEGNAEQEGRAEHAGRPGKVFLVGAGPGDPGLLTLKGAAVLRQAEVVLHDALANPVLIERYAPQAERIDVSKWKGCCRKTQAQINALLVREALAGRRVVRLKGGDPFIFGRGGEEARALVEAGISFEVVPGVSSVAAVPAYAGIPVTDREYASSFGVYSLHKQGGVGLDDEEWRRMAEGGPATLVLLMGKTILETIARKLMEYGRPATTPAALITRGTLPTQRRIVGTLGDIVRRADEEKGELDGPGLVVVGDVVRAAAVLDWFHPQDSAVGEDAATAPETEHGRIGSRKSLPA